MTSTLRAARCLCGLRLVHHFKGPTLNLRFVPCAEARVTHPRATVKRTLFASALRRAS